MTSNGVNDQVVPVNMQSADNWYTLGEIMNTAPDAPASRFLNTQVSSFPLVPLTPAPSGDYGYLDGTQSVVTNQSMQPQGNCGDYFCYADAYADVQPQTSSSS